jgi:cyanate lyase
MTSDESLSRNGMSGKFLPYKYYGATGNALAYGLKKE